MQTPKYRGYKHSLVDKSMSSIKGTVRGSVRGSTDTLPDIFNSMNLEQEIERI